LLDHQRGSGSPGGHTVAGVLKRSGGWHAVRVARSQAKLTEPDFRVRPDTPDAVFCGFNRPVTSVSENGIIIIHNHYSYHLTDSGQGGYLLAFATALSHAQGQFLNFFYN
jgi:hypothetical protein